MKRNKPYFYTVFLTFCLFLLTLSGACYGQQHFNPDSIEVSLLTCSPHDEVYSLYGHTAIRIYDRTTGEDIAVNYGVFDQSKPNFVLRFVFGLTDYSMAFVPMDIFLAEYRYYGSSVTEQVLNMNGEEKRRLISALAENYLPQNREYRYNFFYNNCTTKARDIIFDNLDGKVDYRTTDAFSSKESYRDLLYWKTEGYRWARWGNDILLGVGADRKVTFEEKEFLPEVLMADFDNAVKKMSDGSEAPLVKASHVMLPQGQSSAEPMTEFPLFPVTVFLLLFLLVVPLTCVERNLLKRRLKTVDYVLFTIAGVVGFLLTAMIFSEHPTVKLNLQIFVLNPLWLIIVWYLGRKKWAFVASLVMLGLFFAGNFLQTYAEGMNFLALSLLVRVLNASPAKVLNNRL